LEQIHPTPERKKPFRAPTKSQRQRTRSKTRLNSPERLQPLVGIIVAIEELRRFPIPERRLRKRGYDALQLQKYFGHRIA